MQDPSRLPSLFPETRDRDGALPWPLRIVRVAEKACRFSEYISYAAFAVGLGPEAGVLQCHPFQKYGTGGVRIRGGGGCVAELTEANGLSALPIGGFSHTQVCAYASGRFDDMSYLQLDHVYDTMPDDVYGQKPARGRPLFVRGAELSEAVAAAAPAGGARTHVIACIQ